VAYPNGKKTYAELDLQERWEWHSGVYAFRHVTLDQPIVRGTAPTDPNGEWFDPAMIDREVAKLRGKHARPRPNLDEETRRESVAMLNTFAATKGFVSWDAAYEAGVTYADAIRWVTAGRSPTGSGRNWDYYRPSGDELARARTELGLTATEEPPQERAATNG
jgi:hypothetical protein